MTIRHLYPAVEPSLNLDFANSKRLDPRITFTRLSIGTYTDENGIIRTAADNEARFDHDSDGNSLGLLIEESRTNTLLHSTDFSSVWNSSFGTLTLNTATSPDGTSNAALFQADGVSTSFLGSGLYQTFTSITSGTTITFSIFVKNSTANTVRLAGGSLNNRYYNSTFDFSTSSFTSQSASVISTKIEEFANGWFRLSFTTNYAEAATTRFTVLPDSTNSVYLYGAQMEVSGSFPTSYIPTSGATVTRAAEVTSITGTNFSSWYNQSEGTIVSSITPHDVTNNDFAYSLSDGTSSERIVSLIGQSYSHYVVDGGSIQAQINYAGYTANTETKAAAAYATNDIAYATDGTVRGTDTSATIPTVDNLVIMANRSNNNHVTGHVSRFAYYPVRLPDATLQALTL